MNATLKMPSANNDTLSQTITFLRFPLIIAVVFIHTNLGGTVIQGVSLSENMNFTIHDTLFHILTNEIARTAVPLFFFISGFLFFYKTSFFTLGDYIKKLKKRIKSLFIPYIFWNLVVIFLTFLSQIFLPSLLSGRKKLLVDYNVIDWLNTFYDYGNGLPICYQLWFIRDLIIVVILSPIIYYFIKYTKIYGIAILSILWIFNLWFDVVGFSIESFFFFSLGAWFSINRKDFTKVVSSLRWTSTIAYIILIVIDTYLWYYKITNYTYIQNVGIIIGMITIISWTAFKLKNKKIKPNAFLSASSFFVYAYHGMPIGLLIKVYIKATTPYINEFTMIAGYLLIPIIIVSIGVGIYAILHKYLPSFTALITGGR